MKCTEEEGSSNGGTPRFRYNLQQSNLPENVYASPDAYHTLRILGNLKTFRGYITGSSHGSFILNLVTVTVSMIITLVVAVIPLKDVWHVAASAIMFVLIVLTYTVSIFFLVKTSLTDPGVIPRGRTPSMSYDIFNKFRLYEVPSCMDVVIRSTLMRLKYCDTCNIYRAPRTVHCASSDCCVEEFDHHCPWTGTCIGRKNYPSFYMYNVTTSLLVIELLVCNVVYDLNFYHEPGFWPSVVILIVAVIGGWFPIFMCLLHTHYVMSNITTYEAVKGHYTDIPNPWKQSALRNITKTLFGKNTRTSLIDLKRKNLIFEPRNISKEMWEHSSLSWSAIGNTGDGSRSNDDLEEFQEPSDCSDSENRTVGYSGSDGGGSYSISSGAMQTTSKRLKNDPIVRATPPESKTPSQERVDRLRSKTMKVMMDDSWLYGELECESAADDEDGDKLVRVEPDIAYIGPSSPTTLVQRRATLPPENMSKCDRLLTEYRDAVGNPLEKIFRPTLDSKGNIICPIPTVKKTIDNEMQNE